MKLLLAIALLNPIPHWTIQQSGVTARLRGVSAVSNSVAWASGSDSTVLRTADGGVSWQKLMVTSDVVDFRDIDAIDAQTAYVLSIGNGSASRIYKTSDAGLTWTLQFKNEDSRSFYDAMSFWDAEHGIVMGDSIDRQFCIMTTDNGGRTWVRIRATALPAALENEGAFAASGSNIALFGKTNGWIGTGAAAKARVLRTTDRGRTWKIAETPLSSGPSAGIFSVAFRDAKHGVIVGGDYTKEKDTSDNLALTSDGGATWTLGKGLSGYRSVVAYVPNAKTPTLVAIGPSGADYSIDDGLTWMVLEGPGFDTLSFGRNQGRLNIVGWAAGARGSIGRLVFASLAPPAGMSKSGSYILRSNGIRCITFPCFTWEIEKDGSGAKTAISDIDMTGLHLNAEQKAALLRDLERKETCVRGFTTPGPNGPAGEGLTFHVTRIVGSPHITTGRRARLRCSQN